MFVGFGVWLQKTGLNNLGLRGGGGRGGRCPFGFSIFKVMKVGYPE